MQNDNRETKTKMKPFFTSKDRALTSWEKEDIFFIRWITLLVTVGISVIPITLIFGFNIGICLFIIFTCSLIIPPTIFFRKGIYQEIKKNVSYWWSMIKGEIS